MAFLLIDDVEPGTDHGDAANGAFGVLTPRNASSIAKFTRTEVSDASPRPRYRRERSANSRLGSTSACASSVNFACDRRILHRAIDHREQTRPHRRPGLKHPARELKALVRIGLRERPLEVVKPAAQSGSGCPCRQAVSMSVRGSRVKDVPNIRRLTMESSSPAATRARVAASAAAIHRGHSAASGSGAPSAVNTGAACAWDRYWAGVLPCAARAARQDKGERAADRARATPTTGRIR